MDLQEAWNAIEHTSPEITQAEIMEAIKQESNSALHKLKNQIRKKLYWSVGLLGFFALPMIATIWYPQLWIPSTIILVYYVFATIFLYIQWQKITPEIDFEKRISELLKEQYQIVKQTLVVEEVVSMFFYPISVICGMCFSLILKGKGLEEIFSDPKILLTMLITAGVFTPLGAWFAHYWNKKCLGGTLEKVKHNLYQLKEMA